MALLGTTRDDQPISVDLDRLIGSHMGIVANAGGGKSGLVRKLLEATHGQVQHIILDSEDEFYTLRERFDYVIAGGEGGDTPATVANAAQLSTAALTHGFSLICQINDLHRTEQVEFIDAFLAAMIGAPRDLWHPCLVVIDEAQRFGGDVLRRLTEAGRKRGFTAVYATQRLPKMEADVRGDINNWIMGRCGQKLDRTHIADQMGIKVADVIGIKPREFYGVGPALALEPTLFHVGEVETTIPKPGQARAQTPPPPEALREILAGLAVAPKSESQKPTDAATDNNRLSGARIADLETEVRALRQIVERKNARIDDLVTWRADAENLIREAVNALQAILPTDRAPGTFPGEDEALSAPASSPSPKGERHEVARIQTQQPKRGEGLVKRDPISASPCAVPHGCGKALATIAAMYPGSLTMPQWATAAGYKRTGGTWQEYVRRLSRAGMIEKVGSDYRATEIGAASAGPVELPPSPGPDLARWWAAKIPGTPKLVEALLSYTAYSSDGSVDYSRGITRAELAKLVRMEPSGGSFQEYVRRLARQNIITVSGQLVRLSPEVMGK